MTTMASNCTKSTQTADLLVTPEEALKEYIKNHRLSDNRSIFGYSNPDEITIDKILEFQMKNRLKFTKLMTRDFNPCGNPESEILQCIKTQFFIDVNCPEMQDIKNAVEKFLGNACKALDALALPFQIQELIPGGSIRENARLWDFDEKNNPYVEFDYLAIMSDTCICFSDTCPMCCPAFKTVYSSGKRFDHPKFSVFDDDSLESANVAKVLLYYVKGMCIYWASKENKHMPQPEKALLCSGLYLHEIISIWKTVFGDRSIEPFQGMIDTPSGTLLVDVAACMKDDNGDSDEFLRFIWTSKVRHLLPPPNCLPSGTNTFGVHVDFVPAFKFEHDSKTPNRNSEESRCADVNRFIVAKRCRYKHGDCWKISTMLEEQNFIKEASSVHLDAYKILKFFLREKRIIHLDQSQWYTTPCIYKARSYMIKTVFLYHIRDKQCHPSGESVKGCVHAMLNSMSKMCQDGCIPHFFYNYNLIPIKRFGTEYDSSTLQNVDDILELIE